MTQSILTEQKGSTFLIRMNRPERRNAFDLEMRAALAEAVFEARDNSDIKAVVLAGSQGTFCAGGDLRALSGKKMTAADSRDRIRRLHPWFTQLLNLEKPVIAVVDGPAFVEYKVRINPRPYRAQAAICHYLAPPNVATTSSKSDSLWLFDAFSSASATCASSRSVCA